MKKLSIEDISTKTKKTHFWVFIGIFGVSLLAQLCIQYFIYAQNNSANVINISGRQRMLSQRLVRFADGTLPHSGSNYSFLNLQKTIFHFKNSHIDLRDGNSEKNISKPLNHKIKSRYIELDTLVENLVAAAECIQAQCATVAEARSFIRDNADLFLKSMDEIVFAASKVSKQRNFYLSLLVFFLFILVALFIASEFFLVLKPFNRKLFSFFEKSNRQLLQLSAIEDNAALALISTDPEGIITSFNKAAESLLGYEANDVIGKKTPILFHDKDEISERGVEFSQRLMKPIEQDFKTIVCHTDANLPNQFQWIYQNKDNKKFPVLLSTSTLLDKNESQIGYLFIAQDISEKKNDEKLIVQQKQNMENLQDTVNDAYWSWEVKTKKTELSPRYWEMFGYDPDSKEQNIDEAINAMHPKDRQRFLDAVQKHFDSEGEIPFNEDLRFISAEDSIVWVNARGKVVEWDSEGKPLRMVGAHTDITKMMETFEELIKANDDLTVFAYATSHDLKAPLSASKQLSDFVYNDIDEGNLDEAKKNIKRIQKQMETLERLVSDILSMAKADLKEKELVPVNIDQVIQSIQEKLSWMDDKCRFSIKKDISTDGDVRIDEERLSQILENLISNAIKYKDMKKNEQFVSIEVSENKPNLQIVVKDNGLGIPEKNRRDLFKMFKRFHPEVANGTGLGLSIVKKNIDRMGGTIDVDTSNEGTSFTIQVPKSKISEPPRPKV